jgi:hypothetical protein
VETLPSPTAIPAVTRKKARITFPGDSTMRSSTQSISRWYRIYVLRV